MVSKRSTSSSYYSVYRAVLVDTAKDLLSGALSQSDLLVALEAYGAVWLIESMPQGSKFIVTFKSPQVVTNLVQQGSIVVGTTKIMIEGYKVQTKGATEDEVGGPLG